MNIKVAVSSGGKEIASEILVNPQKGDIEAAGARVFALARQVLKSAAPWDLTLSAREVPDA